MDDAHWSQFDAAVQAMRAVTPIVTSISVVAFRTRDGAVLHRVGDAADTQQFRIASMTKSFTAAAVLQLRDRGLLRLDDVVPELAGLALPTSDSPPITVRMLLTHGGGMATDDPWGDRLLAQSDADFVAQLQRSFARFAYAPDAGFRYSNWGYAILGAVVTRVSGTRCSDYIRDNLLVPLGMASTTWTNEREHPAHEPLDGAFGPMGGLWSTTADMRKWVCFLADAFPARSGDGAYDKVLARHSRREMQSPQRWYDAALALHYGFGLTVLHHPIHGHTVAHSGGLPGWGSHMRWSTAREVAVVALSTGTYAPMKVLCQTLFDLPWVAALPLHAAHSDEAFEPLRRAAAALLALLNDWSDARADELFSFNVPMDRAYDLRRAEAAQHRGTGAQLVAAALTMRDPTTARITLSATLCIDMLLAPVADALLIQWYAFVTLPPAPPSVPTGQ